MPGLVQCHMRAASRFIPERDLTLQTKTGDFQNLCPVQGLGMTPTRVLHAAPH